MPTIVVLIGIIAWFYFVSLDMLATGLPLALRAAGSGEAWIGLIAGWMGIAALLQRPFLAAYGDRRGHWHVLMLSLLAAVVAALLWQVARHPALQWVARTFQGTSLAGVVVASQALMVALAPADKRGRALALQGLADTGGVLVGTSLGEWSWTQWGNKGLFPGSAAVATASWLLALATSRWYRPLPSSKGSTTAVDPEGPAPVPEAASSIPDGPLGHEPGAGPAAGTRETGAPPAAGLPASGRRPAVSNVPAVLVMGWVVGTVFGGVLNLTALHASAAGYRAGTWLAVFALVSMATRFVAGFLLDRGREPRMLLTAAFVIMAAGSLLMARVTTAATAWTGATVLALGYGAAHTTLVAHVLATAPPQARGAAAGFVANAVDLGTGLGLAALGAILQAFSFGIMYQTMAVAAAVGALLAALNSRGRPPAPGRSRTG